MCLVCAVVQAMLTTTKLISMDIEMLPRAHPLSFNAYSSLGSIAKALSKTCIACV